MHVAWTGTDGSPHTAAFDKVVLTTDMHTNATLLNNPQNAFYWDSLYKDHIAQSLWPLQPGACYIHSDPGVLSPPPQPAAGRGAAVHRGTGTARTLTPTTTCTSPSLTYIQANLLANPGQGPLQHHVRLQQYDGSKATT